ncbi:leucine-rich repeat-containing protein 74B-like isoform X3 [Lineus longissimus]|uniref:leucine-rich repeat-containing protein 74B-like isoform X3 n=1 Tax=Lineus longissimus TaxID=88925 RepID=UPI00315D2130
MRETAKSDTQNGGAGGKSSSGKRRKSKDSGKKDTGVVLVDFEDGNVTSVPENDTQDLKELKSDTDSRPDTAASSCGKTQTSSHSLLRPATTPYASRIRPGENLSTFSRPASSTSNGVPFRPLSSRSHSRASSATASRRTVSRAGRKTPSNLQNDYLGESSADESDDNRKDTATDFFDYGVDISTDDKAWDTDLEAEDTKEAYDHTGKTTYIEACKKIGVIPVSYFLRNMHNPKLIMKHHGLGPQGVKPICISMVSNTHVVKLSLADNWLGPQGGQHVSEMLKENCFIQEMDLSDNRVGQLFAETLVDLLSVNITMTKLVLSGNELDDKAAIYLAEAIMVTNRLEDLVISHNKFGEKAGIVLGPAIAENMTIKSLDLSWNHIRRKGAVAIAQGIKHNMFLKTVNLSWNGFGLDGAIAIGDALKANSVLDELDISNNRITAEGAVIIGKGLAVNENLKVLKMGKNPMQTAGCYGILAALLKNPNSVMKRLDFSDILVNKDFREMAQQVKEQLPDLNIHTGGDSLPTRPKARIHPMLKLRNYIAKHDLKLIDVFNKWDTDKSMSVTYEEFVAGVEELGLKLEEEEINTLIHELDKDGDGEINYRRFFEKKNAELSLS